MNYGPFEKLPGNPWSRITPPFVSSVGTPQQPPNFTVTQTVIVQSRNAINPGVLVSGRRPDRPGDL